MPCSIACCIPTLFHTRGNEIDDDDDDDDDDNDVDDIMIMMMIALIGSPVKSFHVVVRLPSALHKPALNNKQSSEFKALAGKLCNKVSNQLHSPSRLAQ